jgi:alkylation response protein AidB-like acyl-CoA dehydrogenase
MDQSDGTAWTQRLAPFLSNVLTSQDWQLLDEFETDLTRLLAEAERDDSGVLVKISDLKYHLARLGYGAVDVPSALGGLGRHAILQTLMNFVCGYHDVDLRDAAHVGHGRLLIGDGRCHNRFRDVVAGGLVGIAVTEPSGGSNLRALTTVARPDGVGVWRLIGEKTWISRLHEACCFVVFFRFPDGAPGAAVVDADAPRLRRRPVVASGLQGWSWGKLKLDGVPIGPDAMLCEPGRGRELFEAHFDYYRPIVAATALGSAAAAYDDACADIVRRVSNRQIERPRDSILETVARCLLDLHGALWNTVHAQHAVSRGENLAGALSRTAKAVGVETAGRVTSQVAPILGARGFALDSHLAKTIRDVRGFMFADGIHDALVQSAGRRLLRAHRPLVPGAVSAGVVDEGLDAGWRQ